MTDISQDPDFLRIFRSGDEEWPGYEAPDDPNASLPLLISEIYRLTPYIGAKYIHFHPKNMSEVMIDKVEIIGIVTSKIQMLKHTSYTVDDTTGAIPVLFKRKVVSEEELSTSEESGNDELPLDNSEAKTKLRLPYGLGPDVPYSYERHMQHLWHRVRDGEPFHDEIELYDYVHVVGFCAMSFRNQKDVSELTDEDVELGRLFLFGINMRRITEAEHNVMTKNLLCNVAGKRYQTPVPIV